MARIHLHGLVIAHAQGTHLRGLMLDSSRIPTPTPLPLHYQSLVLPTKSIVDDQLNLPKVDIRERWRPDLPPPLNDVEVTAWDLSGCRVKVSSSIEGQLKRFDTCGFHPDPDDPNWTPLHWVADARRLFPGATLKKDYRDPGGDGVPDTLSALVEFAGGILSGDRPVAVNGPDWVFFMAPDFVQAITDCMMCTAPNDLSVATLQAFRRDGSSAGTLLVRDDADVFIVNEAPVAFKRSLSEADAARLLEKSVAGDVRQALTAVKMDSPDMGDVSAYKYAFDGAEQVYPQPLYRWLGGFRVLYDTSVCIGLLAVD